MVFPANWPPALPTGIRTLRFYATGTLSGAFADNAWLFTTGATWLPMPVIAPGSVDPVHIGRPADPTASPPEGLIPSTPTGGGIASPNLDGSAGPPAMAWSSNIAIEIEAGAYLEFSFDGETIHGRLTGGATNATRFRYADRHEAGIAIRGTVGAAFVIEAW